MLTIYHKHGFIIHSGDFGFVITGRHHFGYGFAHQIVIDRYRPVLNAFGNIAGNGSGDVAGAPSVRIDVASLVTLS